MPFLDFLAREQITSQIIFLKGILVLHIIYLRIFLMNYCVQKINNFSSNIIFWIFEKIKVFDIWKKNTFGLHPHGMIINKILRARIGRGWL